MSKIQEKWRESLIDIGDIKFKYIEFNKIISYPPAGNDVFECVGKYKDKKINFIVKSERGKFADFSNEIQILNAVKNEFKVPEVIESGKVNDHVYIVLSKIEGEKLSDLFRENKDIDKNKYLYNYGKELAKIHQYKIDWPRAKMRNINYVPKKKAYKSFDAWELKIINYLKETKPRSIKYNTFIHGDFHYGNILFHNYSITGVLDWEYAGLGFKEQDIAWALILRPGQEFMKSKKDRDAFLSGYKSVGKYNDNKLKWCLINGMLHFYLMNRKSNNKAYLENLKEIIELLLK